MNKVYQIVTDKVVEALKNGVVPWSKPWTAANDRNLKSNREYRGINQILLGMSGRGPGWLTANQIEELGGNFKGVKSELVTLYTPAKKKKKNPSDPNEVEETFLLLRYYTVFPVSEVTGLPEKYYKANSVEVAQHNPVEEAEEIIRNYVDDTGVTLQYGGNRAYYSPSEDLVNIPIRNSFKSIEEFYCTVFHELIHSTQKRCGLKDTYAGEELRAEMGAAMLLAHVGLDHSAVLENAAAYCESWAKRIEGEKSNLVMSAASKAQSGVDLILQPETETETVKKELTSV